jgi:hypothetical protein
MPLLTGHKNKEMGMFTALHRISFALAAGFALALAIIAVASPSNAEPIRWGNCYWDGSRPFCAGSCRSGFTRIQKEGSGCITGSRAYCCEPMGFISQGQKRRPSWRDRYRRY